MTTPAFTVIQYSGGTITVKHNDESHCYVFYVIEQSEPPKLRISNVQFGPNEHTVMSYRTEAEQFAASEVPKQEALQKAKRKRAKE
jgi:hypothetical protein